MTEQFQNMLQGYPILSDEEINAGLVFPTVAQTLLGTSGTYLMLALILLAVMSTGSGQVCVSPWYRLLCHVCGCRS